MDLKKWTRLINERDKACVVCGSDEDLHAHHIKPRSLGGKNTLDNGQLLCRQHHSEAHSGELSTTAIHKRNTGGAFDSRYSRAAAIMGVSQTTVYNRIHRGLLPDGTCQEIVFAEMARLKEEIAGMKRRKQLILEATPAASQNEG